MTSTATRIPSATETPSAVGFQAYVSARRPIPPCAVCGVPLNVAHGEGERERDGFLVTDRVPVGVGDVSAFRPGHLKLCRVCTFDPVQMAARKRRLRKSGQKGNFIGAEG